MKVKDEGNVEFFGYHRKLVAVQGVESVAVTKSKLHPHHPK